MPDGWIFIGGIFLGVILTLVYIFWPEGDRQNE